MISRATLKEMGFRKSDNPAWEHEVWYHDTEAWVHYGNNQKFDKYDAYGSTHVRFNGDTDNMTHFFAEFIANVQAGTAWAHTEMSEDW